MFKYFRSTHLAYKTFIFVSYFFITILSVNTVEGIYSSLQMQSKIQFFVFVFSLLFCFSNAFNITSLLAQYPDFSTFNNYLTETQLAGTINSRQTITVLVVSNDAISPLSGKPMDVLKKILSVHVILDYFDVKKLETVPNKTESLVTLFQTSGQAVGQQGFLNATDLSSGSVVIGSAVKGSTLSANVVKSIAAQPYNISVLQISTVINPFEVVPANSTANSTSPALSPTPATNSTSNSTAPAFSPLPATNFSSNSTSPAPAPATNSTSNSTSPSVSPTPVPVPVPVPVPTPVLVPVPVPVPAPARSPRKALSPSPTPSNANTPGLSPTPAGAPGSPPKPADVPAAADAPAEGKKSEGTAPSFGLLGPIIILLCTYISIGHMI